MERNAYLWRCVGISLGKRWGWVLMGAVGGLLIGLAVGLAPAAVVGLAVAGGLVAALWIAGDSWRRHSLDSEAQGAVRQWAQDRPHLPRVDVDLTSNTRE